MAVASHAQISYLRSAQAVRDRCGQLFELCIQGHLKHFAGNLSCLDRVADYVIETTQAQYPDFNIPFHSRWRHFDVGGVPRQQQLEQALSGTALERARAKVDLVVTSVLLDAGAGAGWRYVEAGTGQTFTRSEGLAVASFHLFTEGAFSSQPEPMQVDTEGLRQLSQAKLEAGFQVSKTNPLVGIAGRLTLLHKLGQALAAQPERFGNPARPGHLVDYLQSKYS